MRSRVALVAVLAVLGGLVLYGTRPSSGPTAVLPTPTVTPTPSASGSASATELPPPSSPPALVSAIDLKAHRISIPRDFRYVATGSRLLMLDLGGGTATEVASFSVPHTETGFPRADVVSSQDGGDVLLTIFATPQDATVYLLAPDRGEARVFVRGAIAGGALSPDGSLFAIGRNDDDPALTGLWVGTTVTGSWRRIIADDPSYVGSPPVPYAFSPSGEHLAFGLGLGESGAHAGIISFKSREGSTDRTSGTWAIKGTDALMLGPSSGAGFVSNDELFVWSSRSAFGGQTVAYTYKIATKTTGELYRAAADVAITGAAWTPGARSFAVAERPICCGVALAQTVRVLGQDGSSRKLGEWSVVDVWWSGSGSSAKLYGIVGLDDSTATVVEMLSNKTVMRFCWRGGSPGSCT